MDVRIPLVYLSEFGHLRFTGGTPRRPEVEKDDVTGGKRQDGPAGRAAHLQSLQFHAIVIVVLIRAETAGAPDERGAYCRSEERSASYHTVTFGTDGKSPEGIVRPCHTVAAWL
jgi:hypothetical protein